MNKQCIKCSSTNDLYVCFECSVKPIIICQEHNELRHTLHKKISLDTYVRYMRAIFFDDRYDNQIINDSISDKNILIFSHDTNDSNNNDSVSSRFRPGKKIFNVVNYYLPQDNLNIVSFLSPNSSGKSFLIRSLIPDEIDLPNLQNNDCHLYGYDDINNKIIYLDFPSSKKINHAPIHQELYLQISYVFSDVLCYPVLGSYKDLNDQLKYFQNINRNSILHRQKYSHNDPSLIVILNHKTRFEHKENYDLDINNFEIIYQTTSFVKNNILFPDTLQILHNLFSDVWFININRLINYECILIKQSQRLSKFIQYLLSSSVMYKNSHTQTMNLFPNIFNFIKEYDYCSHFI